MHSPSHPNRTVSPPGPETAIRNPLRPSSLRASSENTFPGPIASPSGGPSNSVLTDLSSAIALCNRIVHLSGPYPTSTSPHRHSASLPSSPSASPFHATGPPLPPIRNAALRVSAERCHTECLLLLGQGSTVYRRTQSVGGRSSVGGEEDGGGVRAGGGGYGVGGMGGGARGGGDVEGGQGETGEGYGYQQQQEQEQQQQQRDRRSLEDVALPSSSMVDRSLFMAGGRNSAEAAGGGRGVQSGNRAASTSAASAHTPTSPNAVPAAVAATADAAAAAAGASDDGGRGRAAATASTPAAATALSAPSKQTPNRQGSRNNRTHSGTRTSNSALATALPGTLPPRSPPTPLTTSHPPTPPHQPTRLPLSGASSPRSSTATGTSVFSAGPAAARQLVVSLSRGSALEKRTALRALLELSESSDAGKLHVTAAGVVPVIAVLLSHPDLGASFGSSSFGSSGGAAGIGGAGGPVIATRTGSGTRSARTSSIGEELKIVSLQLLLSLVSLDENRAVVAKAGCVAILVSILRTGSPDLRAVAARVLWKVAVGGGGGGGGVGVGGGGGDNSRAAIAASEAIPSLVAILQSQTDAAVKQDAADAIAHLTANNEKNQVRVREEEEGAGEWGALGWAMRGQAVIATSEAIPSPVAILQSQTDAAVKQDAADAIAHLTANNEKNQREVPDENEKVREEGRGDGAVLGGLGWSMAVAEAGAIPALVTMLRDGSTGEQERAALVVGTLMAVAEVGAIPALVTMLRDGSTGEQERAALAMAVAEAGAIPALVTMLRDGSTGEQERAALAVGTLAVNSSDNKLAIAAAGAVPLLLDLLFHSVAAAAAAAANTASAAGRSGREGREGQAEQAFSVEPSPRAATASVSLSPFHSTFSSSSAPPLPAAIAKTCAWTLYVLSSDLVSASFILANDGLEIVYKVYKEGPSEAQFWAGHMLQLLDPTFRRPEKQASSRRYAWTSPSSSFVLKQQQQQQQQLQVQQQAVVPPVPVQQFPRNFSTDSLQHSLAAQQQQQSQNQNQNQQQLVARGAPLRPKVPLQHSLSKIGAMKQPKSRFVTQR
ncbi:unnamed protein product [Closterium sp. NIES-64]|nr:unnamed protein product [Closterium sp. NIES-64]